MNRRTWVKFHIIDCLEGSIRYQLDPEERGVWYDLIMYSGLGTRPGVIADKDDRPYPHSFLANRLNIQLELLERTLKSCSEEGRIIENGTGIHIVNWDRYQSEYARQKPYRQQKVQNSISLPNWIDIDIWDAFLEMRKKKNAVPTERAKQLLVKELEKLKGDGHNPNEVLNQSIMRNYTGVFPLKEGRDGTHKEHHQESTAHDLEDSIGKPID